MKHFEGAMNSGRNSEMDRWPFCVSVTALGESPPGWRVQGPRQDPMRRIAEWQNKKKNFMMHRKSSLGGVTAQIKMRLLKYADFRAIIPTIIHDLGKAINHQKEGGILSDNEATTVKK